MKLQERMLRSVKQRAGNVIIRAELAGMGSASQVTEALKALQEKGVLVRIGTGVYAKTRKSSVTGATIPAGSLESLATETLRKLGVQVTAERLRQRTTRARRLSFRERSSQTPVAAVSREK